VVVRTDINKQDGAPELRDRFAQAARAMALGPRGPEAIGQGVLKIYESLATAQTARKGKAA